VGKKPNGKCQITGEEDLILQIEVLP
jgi:hypothetical protein